MERVLCLNKILYTVLTLIWRGCCTWANNNVLTLIWRVLCLNQNIYCFNPSMARVLWLTKPHGLTPQISILIVDNGLEYTALSELWRVPLTKGDNCRFCPPLWTRYGSDFSWYIQYCLYLYLWSLCLTLIWSSTPTANITLSTAPIFVALEECCVIIK
jgi:hypothetical protein